MMIIARESSSSLSWLSVPMTGTHSEDDALTDGEEKELQFHIELGETPPASSTVTTWSGSVVFEDNRSWFCVVLYIIYHIHLSV